MDEFLKLYDSAGWTPPSARQVAWALAGRDASFVLRAAGEAIAMAGLLSDHAMHAFLTELVVAPSWRHRCVGGCLLRYVERYAASSLQEGWKICADLRSSKDAEGFYGRHGYTAMPTATDGPGMERMLTR
ncbi:GNAT family N-acetyltransferase [Bifidobacterium cuniculi]|uniref:GNAT family N-acetyltransferase n=1 Tax=Bifidobacterium cuniculi TaxID=1688 RepID=UPI00052A00CC|nr:GNAT family N-acetyltransferase [Bifidobacterium cuniculi]